MGMQPVFLAALLFVGAAQACSDTICGTIAGEAVLDQQGWPPTPDEVGRATWTYLHATAAYMPRDKLTPEDKTALSDIINVVSRLYPSPRDRRMWNDVVHSGLVLSEFEAIQEKEDVQMWMWKVHNCITANSHPDRPLFPNDGSVTFLRTDFELLDDGTTKIHLGDMNPQDRKAVLYAMNKRWVAEGGLEAEPEADSKEKHLIHRNLPPDRASLGRATWTFLHTMSVYMPTTLSTEQIAAFRSMIRALRDIYPCPVCRHNFQKVYPDAIFQIELNDVVGQQGAILFLWKMHNIVTANEHPEYGLFPKVDKEINMNMFHVPSDSAHQLHLGDVFGVYNKTFTDVMWKYAERWRIIGGLDQDIHDFPPQAACPDADRSEYNLRVDMFLMAMCPFCAKTIRKMHAQDMIACTLTCDKEDGSQVTGAVEWNIHYVGMANATGSLEALHGPHEKYGDKLELCARDLYTSDYRFFDFVACMDRNITLMPTLAEDCATQNGMDYQSIVQCANNRGERLLGKSFGYSSSRGVDATPTIMLNDHKKMLGLKHNLTAIMCQEMLKVGSFKPVFHSTRRWLAQQRVSIKAPVAQRQGIKSSLYEGPVVFAISGFVLFALTLIGWCIYSAREEKREELQELLDKKAGKRSRHY